MTKKETALTTPGSFVIPQMPKEMIEALHKEMKGLPTMRLPTIKIPSGGGISFEIPTEDPTNPDTAKELVGVLVYHHSVNRYYLKSMAESSGEAPDCWSPDGEEGFTKENLHLKCASCPLNEFGSDPKGGKACSNRRRLYVMFEDSFLPSIIEVPPASLKNLTPYIYANYALRGRPTSSIITKFTLKKAKSKAGIDYSEINFTFVSDLSPEMIEIASKAAADMKVRQGIELENLAAAAHNQGQVM